jgi:predicted amidophosphoribosyltransferase
MVKKDPPTRAMMHRMEFESREELDEDFAKELAAKIRAKLSHGPGMLSHL